jgi:hypothetical protein
MRFEPLPLLDLMIEYYCLPRGFERFQEYIRLLTGDSKDDMQIPIVAFNPMGKEHVLDKLKELKLIDAEKIIFDCISEINPEIIEQNTNRIFRVALTLADDLKGGWTNRYTTDYQTKFKNSAFLKRNFCTVMFWTSDEITVDLVNKRTKEFLYRTIYQLEHSKPETLEEHIRQEAYVNHKADPYTGAKVEDLDYYKLTYELNYNTMDYPFIFNFLYGDNAAADLGYAPIGIKDDFAGFKLANILEKI